MKHDQEGRDKMIFDFGGIVSRKDRFLRKNMGVGNVRIRRHKGYGHRERERDRARIKDFTRVEGRGQLLMV